MSWAHSCKQKPRPQRVTLTNRVTAMLWIADPRRKHNALQRLQLTDGSIAIMIFPEWWGLSPHCPRARCISHLQRAKGLFRPPWCRCPISAGSATRCADGRSAPSNDTPSGPTFVFIDATRRMAIGAEFGGEWSESYSACQRFHNSSTHKHGSRRRSAHSRGPRGVRSDSIYIQRLTAA